MVSLETSWSVVIGTVEMIIWPFWFVFSAMISIGMVAVTSYIIQYISFSFHVLILMPC
jgi:hypothetical protein